MQDPSDWAGLPVELLSKVAAVDMEGCKIMRLACTTWRHGFNSEVKKIIAHAAPEYSSSDDDSSEDWEAESEDESDANNAEPDPFAAEKPSLWMGLAEKFTALRTLDVDSLSVSEMAVLRGSPLTSLAVRQISDEEFEALPHAFACLERLRLDDPGTKPGSDALQMPSPAALSALRRLPRLTALDLCCGGIEDEHLKPLRVLPLARLWLNGSNYRLTSAALVTLFGGTGSSGAGGAAAGDAAAGGVCALDGGGATGGGGPEKAVAGPSTAAKRMPLQDLCLGWCRHFDDDAAAALEGLSLTALSINVAQNLTETGLEVFRGMPLRRLELHTCEKLSDVWLDALRGSPLEDLVLGQGYRNKGFQSFGRWGEHAKGLISDAGLEALRGCPLTHLDLSGHRGVTDAGLALLGTVRTLRSLELCGCVLITDAGLGLLRDLVLLERLWLYGCSRIGDPGLKALEGLPIQSLDIGCSRVTNEGMEALQRMPLTALGEKYRVFLGVRRDH